MPTHRWAWRTDRTVQKGKTLKRCASTPACRFIVEQSRRLLLENWKGYWLSWGSRDAQNEVSIFKMEIKRLPKAMTPWVYVFSRNYWNISTSIDMRVGSDAISMSHWKDQSAHNEFLVKQEADRSLIKHIDWRIRYPEILVCAVKHIDWMFISLSTVGCCTRDQ